MTGGTLRGRSWPQADAAFRSDPRWVGGDDAYSIDLQDGRRLWLFGDTFIAPEGGSRADAAFIHNSIAVQHGNDLSSDRLEFLWDRTADGPRSFFPDGDDGSYLWPGHGIRLGDALLLFLMRVRDVADPPLGIETLTFFDAYDWESVLVEEMGGDPTLWRLRWLERPWSPAGALVGPGVVAYDGHLYAFAVDHPRAYVCRWPLEQAAAGDLSAAAWWNGRDRGWVVDDQQNLPVVVLPGAESEFTVHRDSDSGRFVHVQLAGLTTPQFEVRLADRPEGPWSQPTVVDYRPDDIGQPERFFYAGKAHPGLQGGDLVVTHNAIHYTLAGIREHDDLYRPRVVIVEADGGDLVTAATGQPAT